MRQVTSAILLLFAMAMGAGAQSFQMATASALVLPTGEGFIQSSFPFTPSQFEWWYPHLQTKIKEPCFAGFCDEKKMQTDFLRVETGRDGVSQVWLSDSHDFCGPKFQPQGYCSYQGAFYLGPFGTPTLMPDGSSTTEYFGLAIGTFVDDFGVAHDGVSAIFNFQTYPQANGGSIPATGSLIVELSAK